MNQPQLYNDYDTDTAIYTNVNVNKNIDLFGNNKTTIEHESKSLTKSLFGGNQEKKVKTTVSITNESDSARNIGKSKESYSKFMNELKNMGKTNTLKISDDKPINKSEQNNIIKTSVKDRQIKQSSLKIENVNQT